MTATSSLPPKSYGLIEEPSPFDTFQMWEDHIKAVRQLPDDDSMKIPMLEWAEEMITWRRLHSEQEKG